MKRRIQDSQKRALMKAKELRLFKAIENAELARAKSKRKGATESEKIGSAIKSIRSMESAITMLDARIERLHEVLRNASRKNKSKKVIELQTNITKCEQHKEFFSKEVKKAKKTISAELEKD